QRLPEHVVGQQVLVVVEAGGLGLGERRPVLERQDQVPDHRDDAIQQEDRQRRRKEAPEEQRAPRAVTDGAAGVMACALDCYRHRRGRATPVARLLLNKEKIAPPEWRAPSSITPSSATADG